VSWAVQTKLTVGRELKSFEYASATFSTRIAVDELRYGDIVSHVFDGDGITHRCKKHAADSEGGAGPAFDAGLGDKRDAGARGMPPWLDFVSGHVYFFDRWDDANHTQFWAYESTQTENQTAACHTHGPEQCFNHHVLKPRSQPEKWRADNCSTMHYGYVTGGPRRLSSTLLCPS
jgi:hypothetical protein